MPITTTDIYPGAVVHTNAFPFEDNPNNSKPRPVFVIDVNRRTVIARGVFSNHRQGRHEITLNDARGLHHDGYLDYRLVELPIHTITHHISDTNPYYDPYNDFPA